uniref:Uncharacterized protein n=1 Tax=Triticum urartu TaxID=4572 RepID=A0A8R7TXB3_TRIUA
MHGVTITRSTESDHQPGALLPGQHTRHDGRLHGAAHEVAVARGYLGPPRQGLEPPAGRRPPGQHLLQRHPGGVLLRRARLVAAVGDEDLGRPRQPPQVDVPVLPQEVVRVLAEQVPVLLRVLPHVPEDAAPGPGIRVGPQQAARDVAADERPLLLRADVHGDGHQPRVVLRVRAAEGQRLEVVPVGLWAEDFEPERALCAQPLGRLRPAGDYDLGYTPLAECRGAEPPPNRLVWNLVSGQLDDHERAFIVRVRGTAVVFDQAVVSWVAQLLVVLEVVAAHEENRGEVDAHPVVMADMLDEGALPDPGRTDDGEHAGSTLRFSLSQQKADDLLHFLLPAEHGPLQEQVRAVGLAADARIALEEDDELLHVGDHAAEPVDHAPHLRGAVRGTEAEALGGVEPGQHGREAARGRRRRVVVVGVAAAAREGVEHVVAAVHGLSERVELAEHGLVGDAPALGLLDGDADAQQREAQLLDAVLRAALLLQVPLDQERHGPAEQVAEDRGQEHLHGHRSS